MNIHMMQVGPLGVNCYILCDEQEKRCAVIDPGGDAQWLQSAIAKTGCTPVAIFLTHGHYDHTGGAEELANALQVPVYLNGRDVYHDPRMQQLFPLIPNTVSYDEGDVIAVGSLSVTVLATPGHSEGSVTLRCGNTLFCGDTLFAGSMGRTDFEGGSDRKIMASLKRLGSLEGNLEVLPGHMEPSNLDNERRWNPFLRQAMMG